MGFFEWWGRLARQKRELAALDHIMSILGEEDAEDKKLYKIAYSMKNAVLKKDFTTLERLASKFQGHLKLENRLHSLLTANDKLLEKSVFRDIKLMLKKGKGLRQ